jgi:amino acid adenylation domain-containing protein
VSVTDRLSSLTPEQRALFEALRARQQEQKKKAGPRAHHPPPVSRRTGPTAEGDWPLSPDQERLWFLHQLDPDNSAYNVDAASRLRGPLDLATIEACLHEIVRRHAAWRTAFPTVGGRAVQRVVPGRRQLLSVIDLAGLPGELREGEADHVLFASTRGLFDLEEGPLVRTSLVRLAPEDHVCLLVIHHLATDWVTFQHFFHELALLYEASRAGRPSPLPEPALQYPDYVLWQREWMQGEVLQDYVDWWVERLRGFPQVLELPTDRPRPPAETGHGDRWIIHTGRDRAERMRAFARREGATPFILVLALFDVLFHKLSGEDRIVLGTNTANRARPELETVFGYFLTQLPFPTDLAGDPTFREALSRVRKSALESYAHQELPFGKLVEVINPERDVSVMPLIQAIVLVLDAHYQKVEVAGVSFEPVSVFDAHARYDLMIGVYDEDDGIVGPLEFNADLYDRTTIGRWVELFYLLIDTLTADPERRLSELPAFSEAARYQVLAEWNDTEAVYPRGRLHDFIAGQVERTPEAVAVVSAGESLTYRELDRRANRLAHRLIAAGCGPDVPVGILMERSLEMMVGLLATLKAGGAYLPLDPELPRERLGWMVPGVPLILAQEHLLDRLPPCDARILPLPPGAPGEPGERGDAPAAPSSEESLAYILYTSGSTGRPKGVMIPHYGIVNRLFWMQEAYGLTPADRVLQKTPFSFDVSVWELFWPLMFGARLVFAQPGGHRDSAYLRDLIEREGITVLHFVPSMLQVFLEERDLSRCTSPRLVVCSGEALSPDLRDRCLERLPARLENLYGPTEASVDVTRWACAEARRTVPIGHPIANLRIHLLGRDLRPVPLGAHGELYIGGAGLARGYRDRPDLTAERFLPDPLANRRGERLYRTGDLARYLSDGAIDFLGRTDQQVKLRGHRIEPGEIEAALRLHEAVADAAVLLRKAGAGDARLTAFVVPRGEAAARPADLRTFLGDRLPGVMVPSAWVTLSELPLTPSGKVDRRALAGMEVLSLSPGEGERIAPRTPEEGVLATIWSRVLGVREVGIADDFFALGGHSLLATQLVVEVREAFGVDLPVREIFRAPTIVAQAEAVALARARGDGSQAPGPIYPVPREGLLPLSFAQERLWFLDRLSPGSPAYNLPLALRVRGELDLSVLTRALSQAVERHEALRTTFANLEGKPAQVIAPADGWRLPVRDLADFPDPEAEARRLASAEAVRPFDLARGPVFRTQLLRLGPGEHVLLLTVHHITADLWALGVLVRDLATFYAAGETGRPAGLPDLSVQYADFAVWQRGWLQGEALERQLAYWRERLAGAPPALELPTDRPRPPVQSFRGASLSFSAGAELAAALADLGRKRRATLFMTLTAALAVLLGRLSGQEDVVLGAPIANRQRPELAGLVGMFVNTLAVRVPLAGSPGFTDLTDRVRSLTLDDFAHQDVPFEKLVEEMEIRRDLSSHPLFQVALAFQNVPLGRVEIPGGLTLEPLEVESTTTKFDLTFTLEETGGDLAGVVEYATDLFDLATVRRFAGSLRTLLLGAVAAPETPVADLPLLSTEERSQILGDWNWTSSDYPREATLHELFREQAERTPGAVAVVHGEIGVTYRELAGRAGRLARRLRDLGVGPETRVGLAAERTPGMIAGMLAILEAGGAYLPLDPGDPGERLAFLLEDAGAHLVLGERALLAALPVLSESGPRVVCLEDLEERPDGEAPSVLSVPADALAYVMYTSGSTGTPKGVAVTHGNVVRLVRGGGFADLGPEQTWLQLAPPSFDAATLEIWAPLLNGGRLVLFPGQRASLDELAEAITRHGVTSLWLSAGLFHQMVDHRLEGLRPLSQLLAGGDVLSPSHVRRVLAALPGITLVNGYGPTEGTTFTTCHPMTRPEEAVTPHGSVPVGTPIADTRVHILDRELHPVPPGVTGELFAGGGGLARGYLGRPDLTAERFVPDPFTETGARLYRTGDLARYLPDGRIEFLGRADDQVKIRGFRVEPGEVEAALAEHPAVRQAAVLVRRQADGSKALLACVVLREGEETVDLPALERALRVRLPEPLIPASWAVLDSLPLTSNGKMDRRALAIQVGEGAGLARTRPPYAAPRTPLEERLAATASEVLGLAGERRVGIHDNFFELGGHSLLATQLVARLADRFKIEVPLQELFEAADFADLAERVTARELQAAGSDELREMLEDLDGLSPEDLKALLGTEGGSR